MPVNTKHKDYLDHALQWKRCHDAVEGQDAIHDARYEYLPLLHAQTDAAYLAYLKRAQFFNASNRTLDAMTGMIMARPAKIKLPDALAQLTDDITLTGSTMFSFVNELLEEVIEAGRVGVLVDFAAALPAVTMAEAESKNLRPYARIYEATCITNWRVGNVNGIETLLMVTLEEEYGVPQDEFFELSKKQFRVLDFDGEGNYRQRVFRQTTFEDGYTEFESVQPLMNGKPLKWLPFIIIGPETCSAEVEKPPLLDIVDLNLAHYRNSADYEHGLHFTGLPTPWVAGAAKPEGSEVFIGSPAMMFFPEVGARAEYLEFKGEGLKTLQDAMHDKEKRMAVLGAFMLHDSQKVSEAVDVVNLRAYGQNGSLASIARSVSYALEFVLWSMADWANIPATEIEYMLNTDFFSGNMSYQKLTALVSAWQAGAIPMDALLENLKQGDIVSPSETLEDYTGKLEVQQVASPASADGGTGLMSSLRSKLGLASGA